MRRPVILITVLVLVVAACGGGDSDSAGSNDGGSTAAVTAGNAANGETVFTNTCVSCHGPGGAGIDGLGKPMPGSAFITGLSDSELATFIKVGRGPGDPANTTGVDMPAKGGNPALSEQDIVDVVAYIRTLG
ncbi:MAG: cytochrome c [Acidimicrobiia bacterium]|nr:cytochrome c [Acidimicrobiia bacterium]